MSRRTYTSSEVKDSWNRKHYEQILFRVGIGGKAAIKALAELRGCSVAEYIRGLIIADAKNLGNGDISAILGGGGELNEFLRDCDNLLLKGIVEGW